MVTFANLTFLYFLYLAVSKVSPSPALKFLIFLPFDPSVSYSQFLIKKECSKNLENCWFPNIARIPA